MTCHKYPSKIFIELNILFSMFNIPNLNNYHIIEDKASTKSEQQASDIIGDVLHKQD